MKRSVERARADKEPYLIWNAFVDLLAMEDYDALSPLQRKAHLVFWYQDQVHNGGHAQYFENRGLERLAETVKALTDLGLSCHASVLGRATAALSASGPEADWEEVLDESFDDALDKAFYNCTPTVNEALERHLAAHTAEYVELMAGPSSDRFTTGTEDGGLETGARGGLRGLASGFMPGRIRTSVKTWGILVLASGAAIFLLYIGIMLLARQGSFGHLRERSVDPILLIGFGLGWLVLIGVRIRGYAKQRSLSNLAEVIGGVGALMVFLGVGLGSFPMRYLLLAFAFFVYAVVIILAAVGWTTERGPVREHLEAKEVVKQHQAGRRDFRHVDMFGVVLKGVDLSGADLSGADLSGADLRAANLRGAILRRTRLVGACLEEALLTEAQLGEAESLNGAIMPDGSRHD